MAGTRGRRTNLESAAAPAAWSGRLFLWGGRGLYLGPARATSVHAHHAVQICIALNRSFRLRSRSNAAWHRYRSAVVASDQSHQFDAGGAPVCLLYLDPEAVEARPLGRAPRRGQFRTISAARLAVLIPRLRACWDEAYGREDAALVCDAVVHTMAGDQQARQPLDRRIEHALRVLRSAPDRRVPLAQVAAAVALSPSRLVHLFRAETGVPIRRYLLWLRLGDALQELGRSASLTDAAHTAGFADSAHLTRTFRRMLGVTPSGLAGGSRFVQARAR